MNLIKRAKTVLQGERGASNVEIVVWISVVLVIATILFIFRDAITTFLQNAAKQIGTLKVK